MKKIIYLLAIAIFSALVVNAQAKQNALSTLNIRGNVKSTDEVTFNAEKKFGDLVKGKKVSREFKTFNKSGFRTEHLTEDYTKGKKSKRKYNYDRNNNMEEEELNDNGKIEITKKIFNDRGDIIEGNTYDNKGKLTGKTKCKYNNDGLNILTDVYDGEGKLNYATESKYNKERQLVSSVSRDDAKKIKYTQTYEYDDAGNLVEDKFGYRTDNGSMVEVTRSYIFNEKNQIEEEIYTSTGYKSPPQVTNYEYDTKGNLTSYEKEGKYTFSYEYTYDSQNNWIKEIRTYKADDSETLSFAITEREIKYN